jgi:pimeloyl-ACP methyl ester carboxylesterase
MLQPGRLHGSLGWYRAIPYTMREVKSIGIIKTPTLFVYGGKDNFLSGKAAELTKKWMHDKYDYIFLTNGTHWLPEESPQVLAELIDTHIT